MAKIVRKELEQKLAALNGAEWDSMSESGDEGSDGDDLQPPPIPIRAQQMKGKRKGKKSGEGSVVPLGPAGEPSGVVFIGHIPHGFYEEAMNGFFKQFGDVIRVRISKSKKSGRCKVRHEKGRVVRDSRFTKVLHTMLVSESVRVCFGVQAYARAFLAVLPCSAVLREVVCARKVRS